MPEGILRYLMLADTVAIQCGLALMAGAIAATLWLRSAASNWARSVTRASRRLFAAGVVLALAASAAALWLQAAAMGDTSLAAAGPEAAAMLVETHYGHAWLGGIAALLAAGLATTSYRGVATAVAALGAGAFAFTRSIVSHAGEQGDFSLEVGVDWIHLVLVCLWVGMVLLGVFVALRQAPRTRAEAIDCAAWISSLSRAATAALAGIVLTGALKVWWATPSIAQLLASAYGGVLLAKLSLVGIAVALGGVNRLRVMPPLLSGLRGAGLPEPALRLRFAQVLRIEALILLLVFIAAAVLSGTPTPGEG